METTGSDSPAVRRKCPPSVEQGGETPLRGGSPDTASGSTAERGGTAEAAGPLGEGEVEQTATSDAPQAAATPDAEAQGAQPAVKKRRRKRKHAEEINVAAFIRHQASRGPTRKWTHQWVKVRTIVGGGEVRLQRWVTDAPLVAPPGPSLKEPGRTSLLPPLPQQQQTPATPGGSSSKPLPSQMLGLNSGGCENIKDLAASIAMGVALDVGAIVPPVPPHRAAGSSSRAGSVASALEEGTGPSPAPAERPHQQQQQQGQSQGQQHQQQVAQRQPSPMLGSPAKLPAVLSGVKSLGVGGGGLLAFACPECGKSFASSTSLKKHMYVHGDKQYPCTFPGCKRAFVDAGKLARHQITHVREKKHVCPACSKAFVSLSTLRSHWTMTHKDLPVPDFEAKTGGSAPAAAAAAGGAAAATGLEAS